MCPLPEKSIVNSKFPVGLRVLVVDDDAVCLKVVGALLRRCLYEVTLTTKATEALKMLRENKDSYDIVITDVIMLDMDGFQLLETIGLEMDMPVIMMSADEDRKSVMKGIKHGARDYLLKPVRLEELKNIWQHVFRKYMVDPTKPESSLTVELDQQNCTLSIKRPKRGKNQEKEDYGTNTQSDGECSTQRKPRLQWRQELHSKFVDAVQLLGVDKAVPKKILQLMNEPEVSRENVASHLQKFRNLLKKESEKSKMKQENENKVDSDKRNRFLYMNKLAGQGNSNAGVNTFGTGLQQFGSSRSNSRNFLYTLNQQNVLPPLLSDQTRPTASIPTYGRSNLYPKPENVLPPLLTDQTCPTLSIPTYGTSNPYPRPEWNSWRFHSSVQPTTKMIDEYLETCSPQAASFDAGRPGPSNNLVSVAPYSCPPGALSIVGAPFAMHGDASNHLPPISQPDPLAVIYPSSSHESDLPLSQMEAFGSSRNDSTLNGPFVQHHPSENVHSEELNGHYNNFSCADDDLSIMINQFNSSSAPDLEPSHQL